MPTTWIDKQDLVLGVWRGLDQGKTPPELSEETGVSQRTIERLRQARGLLQSGRPDGEVARAGN